MVMIVPRTRELVTFPAIHNSSDDMSLVRLTLNEKKKSTTSYRTPTYLVMRFVTQPLFPTK